MIVRESRTIKRRVGVVIVDVNQLLIFKKVADTGSFTAAGAALGLPKSSVSQKVTRLEQELGVRLLHRTTRRVSLTEIGERVFEAALRIAAEADEVRALVGDQADVPSGLLRITAPHDFGMYVIERVLKGFLETWPAVTVEMDLSNRFVDLVNDRIDVALRATSAPLKESTLVARSLLTIRMRLFASPAWLAANGKPKTVEALSGASAAIFAPSLKRGGNVWELTRGKQRVEIPVRGVLRSNDYLAVKRAAQTGLGIALLPDFSCIGAVERGELQVLHGDWEGGRASCYALYPSRRHVPAKTRAFVDYLAEAVTRDMKAV
jgi:DNA-binding transcriptional LysR family regulator